MAELGLVGIGVMGAAFALNLAEKGHRVCLLDREGAKMQAVQDQAKAEGLSGEILICATAEDLIAALAPPRSILMLVPAGKPLDAVVDMLVPLLDTGDLLADLGNTNFRDTAARSEVLEAQGLHYLGIGISGGEEGARQGPSIMAGGSRASWAQVKIPLSDAAASFDGQPCCDWFGPGGAGHFIKTLHNGIEYADMQLIAETYGIMRDGLQMSDPEIAAVFEGWNAGPLQSYLIEIAAKVAGAQDGVSGGSLLDIIEDKAGQKGTGRWSVVEALHLGSPAGMMAAAVEARNISADKVLRGEMQARFGPGHAPLGEALGARADALDLLENALIAAKIVAYIQGFEVLEKASSEFDWGLDLAAVARVWRAGCIIRSVFLDDIALVFDGGGAANLALAPGFAGQLSDNMPALQQLVAAAISAGLPCSALFAAHSFHSQRRQARGTANMIQGLRDFFGAHGFERVDAPGKVAHGDWEGL